MLVTVGSRKFRMNWKHEPFKSIARQRMEKMGSMDDELSLIFKAADWALRASAKRLGKTTCTLEEVDGDFRVSATVECSLKEGSYQKEDGRKESLTKVLDLAGFSRKERGEIWAQYHSRMEKAA
jgi:hypothetical protein